MHSRNALYIPGKKNKTRISQKLCQSAHDISLPTDGLAWLSSRHKLSGGTDDSPAQSFFLLVTYPLFFFHLYFYYCSSPLLSAAHSLTPHWPYSANAGPKEQAPSCDLKQLCALWAGTEPGTFREDLRVSAPCLRLCPP